MTALATARRATPERRRHVVERRSSEGSVLGTVALDPEVFGLEPNVALMHQVVTAQLAAARAGTQSTKTRAEVAGGGGKPYRQKGTGRARQGSTRSPHWSGGGVALGPKPRSYRQRTPKKMIRAALRCALSDRAREGRVVLVDQWGFEEPKTKRAIAALAALGVGGRVLVVTGEGDWAAERSFANLPLVDIAPATELNVYDVVRSDWVVFSDATIPGDNQDVDGSSGTATATTRRAATGATAEAAADAETGPDATDAGTQAQDDEAGEEGS